MSIEEIIYGILSSDTRITDVVGTNIFPIVGAQNRKLPLLTYTVNTIEPNSGKNDKSYFDTYFVEIDIFSEDYLQLAKLHDDVRDNFEAVKVTFDTVSCNMDYLTTKKDYETKAELFNTTLSVLAHFYNN
jgi:hypothetical protein